MPRTSAAAAMLGGDGNVAAARGEGPAAGVQLLRHRDEDLSVWRRIGDAGPRVTGLLEV